jgi:predicted transcriptional regulator
MAVLWEVPGQRLTGREVADALGEYAYTTVATVLDRLVKKDAVSRRKDGRAFRFTAIDGPAARAATLMREALGATREPDVALARFVQTASPSETEALRRALGQLPDSDKRKDPGAP